MKNGKLLVLAISLSFLVTACGSTTTTTTTTPAPEVMKTPGVEKVMPSVEGTVKTETKTY